LFKIHANGPKFNESYIVQSILHRRTFFHQNEPSQNVYVVKLKIDWASPYTVHCLN